MILFLFSLQKGLLPVISRLQSEQIVSLYLNQGIDLQELQERIGREFPGFDGEIKPFGISTFLDLLKKQQPHLVKELEALPQEEVNSLIPNVLSMKGVFSSHLTDKLKNMPGVSRIEVIQAKNQSIAKSFSTFRWVIRLLVLGIFFVLVTGFIYLVQMNLHLNQDAFTLLTYWGAAQKAFWIPALFNGCLMGLLGGGMAFLIWILAGSKWAQSIHFLLSAAR